MAKRENWRWSVRIGTKSATGSMLSDSARNVIEAVAREWDLEHILRGLSDWRHGGLAQGCSNGGEFAVIVAVVTDPESKNMRDVAAAEQGAKP